MIGVPGCGSFIAMLGFALVVILREFFSFAVSVRSIFPPDPLLLCDLLLPKLRRDIDRGRCPGLAVMMTLASR